MATIALRQFYMRLVGRGKAKKVALLAAARKILGKGLGGFPTTEQL